MVVGLQPGNHIFVCSKRDSGILMALGLQPASVLISLRPFSYFDFRTQDSRVSISNGNFTKSYLTPLGTAYEFKIVQTLD